jgi:hypothetical protein
MNGQQKSTRRAFFLQGGAVLGAGVATTVGAAALSPQKSAPPSADDPLKQLQQQLANVEDREAIRELHFAFTTLIEQQRYESASELFADDARLELSGVNASGKRDIRELFADQYREQKAAAIHRAYRQHVAGQGDSVSVGEDRQHAEATFHVEAEVCTPLRDDCTVAKMARLQGHVADRRWEAGRFDAKYVKTSGQWKVASLRFVTA